MAYGLIYTHEFDSFKELPYLLEIYKKDYTGDVTEIIGGESSVIQKWAADNPMEPIKGSSLEIILTNKNGIIPISSFHGNDDTFYVKFIYGDDYVLFEGYLVQDDCREVVIDWTHEISLSATDNLGLLKDINLLEASILQGIKTDYNENLIYGSTAQPIGGLTIGSNTVDIQAGDEIIIGNPVYGVPQTFVVTSAVVVGSDTEVDVMPDIYFFTTAVTDFTVNRPVDLKARIPLSEFYRMCLRSTGLELNTHIYSRLAEITGDTSISFIEETYLQGETFLDGDVWKSCWDVLTIINKRFGISMFQANGVWNITRPHERRYYNNLNFGYVYDSQFEYVSEINLNDIITIERNTPIKWEFPLDESIMRPYRFAKETFKYKQPKNTLCNLDLQELGDLVNSFIDVDNTVYEYEFPCWTDGDAGNLGRWFVRVTEDIGDNEIARVLVVKDSGTFPSVLRSAPIEVNAGDKVTVSFDFRTDGFSQISNGTIYNEFRIEVEHSVNPATDYRRVNNSGNWTTSDYFKYYWASGTDIEEWNTVEIQSKEILFDGLLYVYLGMYAPSVFSEETLYKNLRFTITSPINGTNKITGHTHTDTQNENIKNNTDEEIFIDDTGRNWIAGTMFKNSFTGLVQDRTKLWNVGSVMFEDLPLGHITTRDNLFWRRISRSQLEGTVYGVVYEDLHVSMLSAFKANDVNGYLNYVAGSMSIDYKKGKYDLTLWEMFNDYEVEIGTVDFDLLIDFYEFKYLFEKE